MMAVRVGVRVGVGVRVPVVAISSVSASLLRSRTTQQRNSKSSSSLLLLLSAITRRNYGVGSTMKGKYRTEIAAACKNPLEQRQPQLQQQPQPQAQQLLQFVRVLQQRGRCQFFSSTGSNINSDSNTTDFFELFGLPRKFGIEPSELKRAYLRLMTEYHPDKQRHNTNTNNGNDNDNDNNTAVTAETITHAYQTLSAPHTRACHWLELHGCPLLDDGTSSGSGGNANDNANDNDNDNADGSGQTELVGLEFLAEMMEWRERLEEATTTIGDRERQQDLLRALAADTRPLRDDCEASLERILDDDDDGNDNDNNDNDFGIDDDKLQQARKLVAQLQYWNRLEETLREATDV
eukprot:jgi/Psemu1/15171/gm1.15171_g